MPTVNRNIIISGPDAARVTELHAKATEMGIVCITPVIQEASGAGASFAILTHGFYEDTPARDDEEELRTDLLYEIPKKPGAQGLSVQWGRDQGWDQEVEPEYVDAELWKALDDP